MLSGHHIGRCSGVIARQQPEARWKPRPQAHRARDITGSVPQPDELRKIGQPLHRRVSQLAGSPCRNVVEDDRRVVEAATARKCASIPSCIGLL